MPSDNDILGLLENDVVYNFRLIWESLDTADEKLQNTVELFTFGAYTDYKNHAALILPLSEPMVTKLLELTVISAVNANVGKSVPLDTLLSLTSPALDTASALENLLISMIDAGVIDVKISAVTGAVNVNRAVVLRDAYDESRPLRIVSTPAVTTVSARKALNEWLHDAIYPTIKDLET